MHQIKKIVPHLTIFLVIILLGTGCDEKIIYEESHEIGSIYVEGITGNTIHLYSGETFQVKMGVLPPNAEQVDTITYNYSSDNRNVFTVNAAGLITGVAVGEAILNVTSPANPNLKTSVVVSVTRRLYPITEIKVDERLKNLTLAVTDMMAIGDYLEILPANASNPKFRLESSNPEILSVALPDTIKALKLGEVILTIKADDGSGVETTCKVTVKEPTYTQLDRSAWTVSPSHKLPTDAAINNAPESLIDGVRSTCLSMVKPGKSYGGVTVGADEILFFVIDMKEKTNFNYLKILHRISNASQSLRLRGISFFGSHDGKTFESIRENVPVGYVENEYTIRMTDQSSFRYLKVQFSDWDRTSGNTVQIAEFELGTFTFK